MPSDPETPSVGEPTPNGTRSGTRKSAVFSRTPANAAPVPRAVEPETVATPPAPPEDHQAISYHFDPIGTGTVTGSPGEPDPTAQAEAADQPGTGNFATPILPRRTRPNRQQAEMTKRPKNRGKLRKILEELAENEEVEDEEEEPFDGQPAKILQARRLSRTGATPEGNPMAFRRRPDQPQEVPGRAGDKVAYALPGRKPYNRLSLLLAWTCLLLLGLVAYLWLDKPQEGNTPARREPSDAAGRGATIPATISSHAMELAVGALAAEKSGNYKKAAGLYQQARNERLALPELDYQSASLALETGDYNAALLLVNRSIEANENIPQCLYLRANAMALDGDFGAAAAQFALATRLTPFRARNYFFQAECLRRKGNFQAAMEQFEQALLRRTDPLEAELIAFRMNLTKIEAGGDKEVQKLIAERLASAAPSGDTLLLAAASELQQGNHPAAAELFQRCLSTLPRPVLDSRLNDYFFRLHLQQSQIAAVLNVARPRLPTGLLGSSSAAYTQPPPINLAERSLVEADPAGWP